MNLKEAVAQTAFVLTGMFAIFADNHWIQLPCLVVFSALSFWKGRKYERAEGEHDLTPRR